jgi:beta-mannosidase
VQATHYWVPPKDLDIPAPELQMELDQENKTLRITAQSFIKDLFLDAGQDVHFQENFFDLLPGETRTITYEGIITSTQAILMQTL